MGDIFGDWGDWTSSFGVGDLWGGAGDFGLGTSVEDFGLDTFGGGGDWTQGLSLYDGGGDWTTDFLQGGGGFGMADQFAAENLGAIPGEFSLQNAGYQYDPATNTIVGPDGSRTTPAQMNQAQKDLNSGDWAKINQALASPAGKIAALLAGFGATRLLAGQQPTYPQLAPPQRSLAGQAGEAALLSAFKGGEEIPVWGGGTAGKLPPLGPAITGTIVAGGYGQRDLAAAVADMARREAARDILEAPGQEYAAREALGRIPSFLPTGQVFPYEDPIQKALQAQVLGMIERGPGQPSPQTAARQADERKVLEARMTAMLGRDWELTTPGIQAANELNQRHNRERYQEWLDLTRQFAPMEESRQRFAATFPEEQYARREGARRGSIADLERISELGRKGVGQMQTALGQLAPIQRFMGTEAGDQFEQLRAQLAAQQALGAYQQESQQQRELTSGLSQLFGTIAGELGKPSGYRLRPLEGGGYDWGAVYG